MIINNKSIDRNQNISDNQRKTFHHEMLQIALPITFQSLCQSSLSVIDQIMVGQLGSVCIAGVGLGGKFSSLFTVTVSAISTAAGILISQYYGKKDKEGISKSFMANFMIGVMLALLFTIPSIGASKQLMSLYSYDPATITAAADYLVIIALGFIPMTITLLMSTLLRSIGYAKYPMFASVVSVFLNTFLNYIFIFGKLGFSTMGIKGAAYATTISRLIEMIYIIILFIYVKNKHDFLFHFRLNLTSEFKKKLYSIIGPLLACEFLWSLGENIYGSIYGRIGTDACAAMTLTNPIQALMIGAFTGLSAASGIMVGKKLGKDSYDEAYDYAKTFIRYGFIGTIILGLLLAVFANYYVLLFNVSKDIRHTTILILYVYAVLLTVKVQNMILGGGILRSGGKTHYTLITDLIGTWIFGIPLGLLSAYVFQFPIYYVYLMLSLEECVRLIIVNNLFIKKKWMTNITI